MLLGQHEFQYDGDGADSDACRAGLWSWSTDAGEANDVARAMLQRITPAPHPNRSALAQLFGALRFTEPPPRRLPMTRPSVTPSASGSGQRPSLLICVVGDSQMRTLADGMVQHMAESGGAGCACAMAAAQTRAGQHRRAPQH